MRTHVDTPQSCCQFSLAHGDITPPVEIYYRMWGAATQDHATGVHRPLRATVTLLAPHEGEDRQFVIALDHCVMGRREMDDLLEAVSAGADIPREELIVVFSHTHAAGLMGLERSDLPGGNLIAPYLEQLGQTVVRLAIEACDQMQSATIIYGTGRCSMAAHRDFWDPEHEAWICGYHPDAPGDDTVLAARVHDADRPPVVGFGADLRCIRKPGGLGDRHDSMFF